MLIGAVSLLVAKAPVSILNVPHKEHWVKPENTPRVRELLLDDVCDILGDAVLLVTVIELIAVVRARSGSLDFPIPLFLAGAGSVPGLRRVPPVQDARSVHPSMNDLTHALRQAGLVDVDDSPLAQALYSSDASLYRVPPRVVVRPRHVDELDAVLAVSRELRVPVTMRGAGTSIAGNAIGPGIVVDTSRHLNRSLAVDPEARTAIVEPGVVHASLQRAARRAPACASDPTRPPTPAARSAA